MQARDIVAYLFLACAWGLSFLVVLNVVQAFGWAAAVSLRSLIAGCTLLMLAKLCKRRLCLRPILPPLLVVAATTVAGQLIGLSYATPLIGTAMAAILVATIPLFSMLIGRLWGLEKITPGGLCGLFLGFLGITLLVGFPAQEFNQNFLFGCLLSLLGSFCGAFGSNYAILRLRAAGAWEVTAGAFLLGGLLTLPLLLLIPIPTLPTARDYLYLVISGSIMSASTYVIYFGLVRRIGATRTVSVEFVVTLVAVLVGALGLGENLSLLQIIGGLVILLGCLLVLGMLPGKRRNRQAQLEYENH
jgi:drug/metabolite transporter (DMT)-like permease